MCKQISSWCSAKQHAHLNTYRAGCFAWFAILCACVHTIFPLARSTVHNMIGFGKHSQLIEIIAHSHSLSLSPMANRSQRCMCVCMQNAKVYSVQCAWTVTMAHKMVCKRMHHQIALHCWQIPICYTFSSQHTAVMMIPYKCKLHCEHNIRARVSEQASDVAPSLIFFSHYPFQFHSLVWSPSFFLHLMLLFPFEHNVVCSLHSTIYASIEWHDE